MEKTNTAQKDSKVITVLKWIFSILFLLSVIGTISEKAYLATIIFLILGFLLLPPMTFFWREKFPFLKNRVVKGAVLLVLFIIGTMVFPKSETTNSTSSNPKASVSSEPIISIPYEILHETSIRYDKAPSYFVLIDKVDLSNDKFKSDIKTLINKIVTEKGAKISVSILDDKIALELMYKSHYGINELGRILNKKELKSIEKHNIASFSGELETDIYLNTLTFFPSTDKKNRTVGKYVDTEEYNPKVQDNTVVKKQREEINSLKEAETKKIEDFKMNCFSAWDGSHRQLEEYIKTNMNDPDSYEHVKTEFQTLKDFAIVQTKFRGKNGFGGVVVNTVKAKVSYDCQVLEILGQE